MMKRILQALKKLLYPGVPCLACGDPRRLDAGAPLCGECEKALEKEKLLKNVCPRCLSPRRAGEACEYCLSGGMDGIDAAHAPYHYHGIVQKLVVAMKFSSVEDAGLPLAAAMRDAAAGINADMLVPIPLHPARLRERGFNQAEALCRMMNIDIPVVAALKRPKKTRRQSQLKSTAKRTRNVENAFLAAMPVEGKRILLVDDVRTTGATARACAKALKEAGAAQVTLLTAAVAPRKKEGTHP